MFSYANGVPEVHISEPKIGDVCASCNSGPLSLLDNYGKMLSEKYFQFPILGKVTFEYTYDMLLRWLIKVIYNGARAFKSSYSMLLPYIPFVLGKQSEYPETFLYLAIMKASRYEGVTVEPRTLGISEINISNESGAFDNIVLSKAFYFYSYFFILVGLDDTKNSDTEPQVRNYLNKKLGVVVALKNLSKVELDPNNSKLDYLFHMYMQNVTNPKKFDPSLVGEIPFARQFHFVQQPNRFNIIQSENCIITILEESYHLPILTFEETKIHADLVLNRIPTTEHLARISHIN
jgi:hypothetical protein